MFLGPHRHWAFPAAIALAVLILLVSSAPFRCGVADDGEPSKPEDTGDTGEEEMALLELGAQAVAAREKAMARAVTVLNEGPQLHSDEELGVAVKLLGDLQGDTSGSTWALLNYLTYRFPTPAEWSEWAMVPLDVRAEQPSASRSLSRVGLCAVPCLVSRLADTDDSGMRHECMQMLGMLMGKHAIPVLESATQQTPDPEAQARLADVLAHHRGYFVGAGCFQLPPPYRGRIPQW